MIYVALYLLAITAFLIVWSRALPPPSNHSHCRLAERAGPTPEGE